MATKNKQHIVTALELCKQIFTWDVKLHKDVFTHHLRNNLEQSRLNAIERAEVLNIMENILYVVTDRKRYVSIEDTIRENDHELIQESIKDSMEKLYDLKTMKGTNFQRDDWKTTQPRKQIHDELLQLKIRLHEEIMVVKNDIKLCKDFIKINFEDPLTSRSLTSSRMSTRRNSDTSTLSKRLGYTPRPSSSSKSTSSLPRSNSSSSLSSGKKIKVRRKGSTTSLLDEFKSDNRPSVCVLLGDSTFDQISQKRLLNDNNKRVESFCKSHHTVESGFEKLTDFVIENPNFDVSAVCILLGANNLEHRSAQPTDLALYMLNSLRNLTKRISGYVYVYALLPRLDNATLDRQITHFNSQLANGLFQARLPRVTIQQNIIQREAKLFHADGKTLAGAGLNKLMRAVRKNMANDR